MARSTHVTLEIEGYKAEIWQGEIVLSRQASFNQLDDRSRQLVLAIPSEDAVRVGALLREALEVTRSMAGGPA